MSIWGGGEFAQNYRTISDADLQIIVESEWSFSGISRSFM